MEKGRKNASEARSAAASSLSFVACAASGDAENVIDGASGTTLIAAAPAEPAGPLGKDKGWAEMSDGEKKAAVEARNEADTTIYNTEKTLMEHKAKVPQEDQDVINADIAALKAALADESTGSEH